MSAALPSVQLGEMETAARRLCPHVSHKQDEFLFEAGQLVTNTHMSHAPPLILLAKGQKGQQLDS